MVEIGHCLLISSLRHNRVTRVRLFLFGRHREAGQLFPALCLPLNVLHIGLALLHRGELSPVELVESRLSRIEKLDGTLHCFIWLMTEERVLPRTAEAEIIAGRWRGPLHGVAMGWMPIQNNTPSRTPFVSQVKAA